MELKPREVFEMKIALEELRAALIERIDRAIKVKDEVEELSDFMSTVDHSSSFNPEPATVRRVRKLYSLLFNS